jgi:aryl-alcohol dehydrogenase
MKIQAAVSREGAPRPFIETVELEDPRPGEILVRSVASGICHTDLGVHARPGPKPIVLGHEGAGIVERVGSGVTRLAPGDHVVMSVNFCGQCPNCLRGNHSYCYEGMPRNFGGLRPDGTSPISQDGQRLFARFFGQSSFASYVLADASAAVKVPKDLPLEILGPLGCGITTGAGTVINSFKMSAGQSIAIFGSGAVGLSAVMAAKLVGAVRIIAIDVVPERLKLAMELGATDTVNSSEKDPVEAIKAIMRHGVDFAFNTTRVPAVFTQAISSLAPLGVAGFVAAPPPHVPWQPDLFALLSGGRSLRGILGGDSSPGVFIPMLIEYYRQGRMPFDRLIRFYPFAEIGQAFEDIETGRAVKPVLRFA